MNESSERQSPQQSTMWAVRLALALAITLSIEAGGALAQRPDPGPAGQRPDPGPARPGASVPVRREIGPALERQIQGVIDEKRARTPAQRKIGSQLLYEMKRRRGDPLFLSAPGLKTDVQVDAAGQTLVDIKAEVSDALLDRIEALGGSVVNALPQFGAVRARLPLDRIEEFAASPDVRSVRPAERMITRKINTSEGDVAHRADDVRAQFGIDGTGVKICALSDGVDQLATVQATGDLPAVQVLADQAGSGSEGTAMLEIIHDLAPGATLAFATAFGGQAQFAANILALRNTLNCDVIVDDVFYFAESVFQDGVIAQAVNTVTADGAIYASSAGNSGNLNDGTSGAYEGDYVDSGQGVTVGTLTAGILHDFDGNGTIVNEITQSAPFAVTLHWSDANGASSNDYDFCIVDRPRGSPPFPTTAFACSTDIQDGVGGNDNPFEIVGAVAVGPGNLRRFVVIINSGSTGTSTQAARHLHLNTIRGQLATATDGQTAGHSSAPDAFSVAAVDVADANVGGGGGFPGTGEVENFSSDGPRQMFFNANGTPITAGNFLVGTGGGAVRQDPDITAADGVSTATSGFNPFFGTSAAAPHVAAIGGLLLSLNAGVTPAMVRTAILGTATDIEAAGTDRDSGAGIVDALSAAIQVANLFAELVGDIKKAKEGCRATLCRVKGKYVITNNGTVASGPFTVGFYQSSDANFGSPPDILIKSVAVSNLGPGESQILKVKANLPGSTPAGGFVIAVVDDGNAVNEGIESNNVASDPL